MIVSSSAHTVRQNHRVNVLAINPATSVSHLPLPGGDKCLIFDDFLISPSALRAYGKLHRTHFTQNQRNRFPGIELALPDVMLEPLSTWWRRDGRKIFGVSRILLDARARLSLVCVAPSDLSLGQRVCHRDALRKNTTGTARLYAGVIYLFKDTRLGGTAFYRQREGVDMPRVQREIRDFGEASLSDRYDFFKRPPGYLTDSCEFYEQVGLVPARYNRAIFYPGDVLHSGQIERPDLLSESPDAGRLTLNIFIEAVPL